VSKILLVDDDRTARKGLYFVVKSLGEEVKEAENIEQAEQYLMNNEFDLVISDLRLPNEENGLNLARKIKQKHPITPVLMITAYGSVDSAVKAMKSGADDYVTKDFEPEEIILKIKKMLENRKLHLANLRLSEQVSTLKNKFGDQFESSRIIGNSPVIKNILNLVARVGQDNDSTVLITGESGTGKELIARSIHQNNPVRSKNKFVVVDVANMPATLLESQLFGHEKGSFTSAHQKHIGFIEIANGGTVFLDEIGDFPFELQVKLLRFLQEKSFVRVGGEKSIFSDVRIIAATNRDLGDMVVNQRFRDDLYYRLNVVKIFLPPLRERREDIPALINYYQQVFEVQKGRKLEFPPAIINKMISYDWPGNIRQLKNMMESLFVVCPDDDVKEKDLLFDNLPGKSSEPELYGKLLNIPLKDARHELVEKFESIYIKHHLQLHGNNISKMASSIGESREGLSKKIKKYGLKGE